MSYSAQHHIAPQPSVQELARQVRALTEAAWQIPPASARAVARRAPHGYVPQRAQRRQRQERICLPTVLFGW